MAKTIAYIRVSTVEQDVNNQRLAILEYARNNSLHVDDFIEIEISSKKTQKARRIEELLSCLETGDTLIISELSRLGRSTSEVIDIINALVDRRIRVVSIKQNIDIKNGNGNSLDMGTKIIVTMFSLFAELERDIISERTKMALQVKKQSGKKLGKPFGALGKSKLDGQEVYIKELLSKKVGITTVARILSTSRTNLLSFIRTRKLSEKNNKG